MTRRTYIRTKSTHVIAAATEPVAKTCFINDLLDGTIQATTVSAVRVGKVLVRLEYEDPDRPGAGQGGSGTRGP